MTACSTLGSLQSTASKPQYLYAANAADGTVSAYRINTNTGALTQVPGSPFATRMADSITVNPAGTFAYVLDYFGGSVSAFRINAATGALTPIAGSPFGVPYLSHVAINHAGTFAYMRSGNSNTISAFSISAATGALAPIPGSPFPTTPEPLSFLIDVSITIDPAGSFVYAVSGADGGSILAFRINAATGALLPVSDGSFGGKDGADSITINPAGTFAYAVNRRRHNVSVYRVNAATGALTQVQGSPFPAPGLATHFVINPAGTFAYGLTTNNIALIFRLNLTTGAFTTISRESLPAIDCEFSGMLINPAGTLMFEGCNAGHSISVFSINGKAGALTPVPGSPFAAGTNPANLAIAKP